MFRRQTDGLVLRNRSVLECHKGHLQVVCRLPRSCDQGHYRLYALKGRHLCEMDSLAGICIYLMRFKLHMHLVCFCRRKHVHCDYCRCNGQPCSWLSQQCNALACFDGAYEMFTTCTVTLQIVHQSLMQTLRLRCYQEEFSWTSSHNTATWLGGHGQTIDDKHEQTVKGGDCSDKSCCALLVSAMNALF